MALNPVTFRFSEYIFLFFFIPIPISVHLSSSLLIVRDQLLMNLPAVLHIGQRVLLVTFPHHKQDHYD